MCTTHRRIGLNGMTSMTGMTGIFAKRARCAALSALLLVLTLILAGAFARPALADELDGHGYTLGSMQVQESYKNTIEPISDKERKAYNRAVRACMNYEKKPNPIVVDMSDLGLTQKQALNVGYMLHGNGELFWINTYNDSSYGKDEFSLPCYYDDATITKMRRQVDSYVNKALKRVGPGMTAAAKVHMLHDYVIDRVDYGFGKKDAYTGLVEGKGDCFGFALTMDLLLRRAGFSTDMAFNDRIDHAWNIVKVGSHWYHVDTTWDNNYSGKNYDGYFNWTNKRCHVYLLQSDAPMKVKTTDPTTGMYMNLSHAGWTCHHACTDKTYDKWSVKKSAGAFYRGCNEYKSIVRAFKKAGLKYEVTGVGRVQVASVASKSARAARTISIPATVTFKKTTYVVNGIAAGAFSKAKAKTLRIGTAKLTKAHVKGSLNASKVKRVKLVGAAAKQKVAYKKYFEKSNSGKKVSVV